MLKISLPNFDVKSASPEQLAVDTTYDSLKAIVRNDNPFFGEILVKFSRNPGVGTYPVFTFMHGFDYTPLYYVFFDDSKSSLTVNTNTGYDSATQFGLVALIAFQKFQVSTISGGFKIEYIVTDNSQFDATNSYFSFRYFVYVNDGV